jgi:hypothetical protein
LFWKEGLDNSVQDGLELKSSYVNFLKLDRSTGLVTPSTYLCWLILLLLLFFVSRCLLVFFFFFLAVQGFELSFMVPGICSTTWATPSIFLCVLDIFKIGSCEYLLRLASNHDLPDLCFQ